VKTHVAHVAFNRGLLSKYGLARLDLKVAALAAETMTNWMPRALGSMMLRPGLGFIGRTHSDNAVVLIPFVFSTTDTALLELSSGGIMRVWINDALLMKVAGVTTTIGSPTFTPLAGVWDDIDELATESNDNDNKLNLTGNGYNSAGRRQTVTVPGGSLNKEHRLRIIVERGPVTFRCGSTAGGDEYIEETQLRTGTHSLAFTPTGNFHVEFTSSSRAVKLVTSIAVETFGTGIFNITTPWVGDQDYLRELRWDQSGDVVFVAKSGQQTMRIERRDNNSWSIVDYAPTDGPFLQENITPISIATTGQAGDITLTSSRKYFRSSHVGALFQLTQNGQAVLHDLAGGDQFTDSIRITGVGEPGRNFELTFTGTWVGTLTLQRSFDDGVTWEKRESWTTNQFQTRTDSNDGQVVLYRVGFVGSHYTSGIATVQITANGGGSTGVVRVTSYISETQVTAAVQDRPGTKGGIKPQLGGTDGTTFWAEGAWSQRRGFPTSLVLHDGRLFLAGQATLWGSISDAFESHDDATEGDSGPINRTLGSGPVDNINWLLSLVLLVMGADGAEIPVRASTQDEVLTNTNIKLKASSNQGSAAVPGVAVNDVGFFVHRSGTRLMKLLLNENYNYVAEDQSALIYDTVSPGIVRLAVQRQPDTRVHCVLSDGRVGVLVFDKTEEVAAWVLVQMGSYFTGVGDEEGIVQDVVVLPGTPEDQVYYVVSGVSLLEGGSYHAIVKWAREDECRGGTLNKQADRFMLYSGAATLTVSGLTAFGNGAEVVVWADGTDRSPTDPATGLQTKYVVTGQSITVTVGPAFTQAVIGLPYTADYKSSKLAYGSGLGSALNQPKIINQLGLLLADTHNRGLQYGQDFDHLDFMPLVESMDAVGADVVHSVYDEDSFPLNGTWDTDTRLCLRAQAPRPCNVLAALMVLDEVDKN
jgi:hypothetical protein